MQTIQATFQNGIFAPKDAVDLADGTQVTLQVEVASTTNDSTKKDRPVLEYIETEEISAPYDFPMPGIGEKVKARVVDKVLPDPPIFLE